jgi:AcrR family transcriptional regulator
LSGWYRRSIATTNERPRKTYAERNADSHRRLMDAAIELIAEKGFERTTAQEIGQRAGYSRNMVRDRYGSKEALLEALCEQEFADRLLPEAGRERTGTGLELVLSHIDDLLVAVRSAPEQFRAIVILAFEATGPIPATRDWWASMIERYEAVLVDHLRAGQSDGSVRPGLDVAREAEAYVSYGAGLCFRWCLQQPGYDFAAELAFWRDRLREHFSNND